MAVDTRNKRSSAIHISLPWRGMYPNPDGAIDQADRQASALMYSGILASGAAPVVVSPKHIGFLSNIGTLMNR